MASLDEDEEDEDAAAAAAAATAEAFFAASAAAKLVELLAWQGLVGPFVKVVVADDDGEAVEFCWFDAVVVVVVVAGKLAIASVAEDCGSGGGGECVADTVAETGTVAAVVELCRFKHFFDIVPVVIVVVAEDVAPDVLVGDREAVGDIIVGVKLLLCKNVAAKELPFVATAVVPVPAPVATADPPLVSLWLALVALVAAFTPGGAVVVDNCLVIG